MKNKISNIILLISFGIMLLCICKAGEGQNGKKPDMKVYAYIRSVINYEKSAINFNKICATQARKQGLTEIANTFEAMSKSDNELYSKLKETASNLGIDYSEKQTGYPIMSTIENLKRAYTMEEFERKQCGEGIKVAKNDNVKQAEDCFTVNIEQKESNKKLLSGFKNQLSTIKTK